MHVEFEFQSSPGPRAGRCRPRCCGAATPPTPFQSSPGPRAGRCQCQNRTVRVLRIRFNPRPARGPGAARLKRAIASGSYTFQSSPGPRAGRCAGSAATPSTAHACFNPRPARGPGAAMNPRIFSMAPPTFQSSPGPRAGRCLAVDHEPGRLALLVSILARPEGRALPSRSGQLDGVGLLVSILARPEGRALPTYPHSIPSGDVEFQSSPGPRAGRCPETPCLSDTSHAFS